MFRFANPHLLWLLLVVPIMVIAFAILLRLRKRNLQRFGNIALVQTLLRDDVGGGYLHLNDGRRLYPNTT